MYLETNVKHISSNYDLNKEETRPLVREKMKEKEKLYSTFISFPSHLVRRVGGENKNYGNGIPSMNYES